MISFSYQLWADSVGDPRPGEQFEVCSTNGQICAIYTAPYYNEKPEKTKVFRKDNKAAILYTLDILPSFISDDGHYAISNGPWNEHCEAKKADGSFFL